MTIPFPAIKPSSWEFSVPGYPVITNSWRSSEYPEILGSLPENTKLSLRYENIPDSQALELLLTWRATAGGVHALNPLPVEVAAGIADLDLVDRILGVTPLNWIIFSEPRQESVKAGRSTVEIELKTELRVELSASLPAVSCPTWSARALVGCAGGAGGVGPPSVKPLPPLIGGGGGGNPPPEWKDVTNSDVLKSPTDVLIELVYTVELGPKTRVGCGFGFTTQVDYYKTTDFTLTAVASYVEMPGTVSAITTNSCSQSWSYLPQTPFIRFIRADSTVAATYTPNSGGAGGAFTYAHDEFPSRRYIKSISFNGVPQSPPP